MSGRSRLHLPRGVRGSWEMVACALERASFRAGDACVVDAHGVVLAELLSRRGFAVRLPAGLAAPIAGSAVPACHCARGGTLRGCLVIHRAPGEAVVLTGQCARVLACALLAAVAAHPRALYLELADPKVLPRTWCGQWCKLERTEPKVDLGTISAAQLTQLYRAYLDAQKERAAESRPKFWVGYDRCMDCNRELSDPISIERGRGEICEGRHRRRRRALAAR